MRKYWPIFVAAALWGGVAPLFMNPVLVFLIAATVMPVIAIPCAIVQSVRRRRLYDNAARATIAINATLERKDTDR